MKLIILDRDGTINHDSDDYIKSADEWVAIPGALEAVAKLNHAGWHVVVATNQSGIGRGLFDIATLNAIHAKMMRQLATAGARVDAVFYCPHTPEDDCQCRKPRSGLFTQIGERFNVELTQVHTVGDTLRDIQAGAGAGCMTHLVLTGKGVQYAAYADIALHPLPAPFPEDTLVHASLAAFADYLLALPAMEA